MVIKKDLLKDILISLFALTLLTEAFNLFYRFGYEKNEYIRICSALYSEKVWYDKCILPYTFEGNTLQLALKTEIALVLVTAVLVLVPLKKK